MYLWLVYIVPSSDDTTEGVHGPFLTLYLSLFVYIVHVLIQEHLCFQYFFCSVVLDFKQSIKTCFISLQHVWFVIFDKVMPGEGIVIFVTTRNILIIQIAELLQAERYLYFQCFNYISIPCFIVLPYSRLHFGWFYYTNAWVIIFLYLWTRFMFHLCVSLVKHC